MPYSIPYSLETERLHLRMPQEADWEPLMAYYADENCMRYTTRTIHSAGEVWRKVALMRGHWDFRNFGPYILEEKSSGKVIGVCGLWYPGEWPEPEIKWGIIPSHQQKGFAREAALLVRETAAQHLPDLKLISLIDKENVASIALALSMGCTAEQDFEMRGIDCTIYRHKEMKD